MCSWCWGYAPVIKEIRKEYDGRVDFSLVLGGLRSSGEMPWDSISKAYLKSHWQQVAQQTGQEFNDLLFEKECFDYNTYPACKAVVTVRSLLGTEAAFTYLHMIQKAFYTQGIDISNPRLLQGYYDQCFGDSSKFAFYFRSERAEVLTEHDFFKAHSMGATTFPSVVIIDEEGHMLCEKGYRSNEEMKKILEYKNA